MEKQRKKQCEEGIKIICAKYRLKLKEISNNEIAICAKNSAKKWVEWIKFNFDKENIIVNKEQCSSTSLQITTSYFKYFPNKLLTSQYNKTSESTQRKYSNPCF